MKIGVTGASGMVGINVCKEILSNGDELNILIRENVSYLDGLSCNKFYGDLSDIDTLEKFCDKFGINKKTENRIPKRWNLCCHGGTTIFYFSRI